MQGFLVLRASQEQVKQLQTYTADKAAKAKTISKVRVLRKQKSVQDPTQTRGIKLHLNKILTTTYAVERAVLDDSISRDPGLALSWRWSHSDRNTGCEALAIAASHQAPMYQAVCQLRHRELCHHNTVLMTEKEGLHLGR